MPNTIEPTLTKIVICCFWAESSTAACHTATPMPSMDRVSRRSGSYAATNSPSEGMAITSRPTANAMTAISA